MRLPRSLLSTLLALARAWWRHDRVRASPNEGRLLRLGPGAVLRIAGRRAVVQHRRVGETAEGSYVAYECEGEAGPSQLLLRHTAGRIHSTASWREGGAEQTIGADSVEAYPAPRGRGYNFAS